jgi:AraC-like DNA-binding protein
MPTVDTLSAGSINLVLYVAERRGADAAALRRALGLTDEFLRDPDARVPIASIQRLWALAVEATGDPALSLRIGELVNPLSIGVLAYVMMHSPTVRQALGQLCRYQDIACEGVRTTVHETDETARIDLTLTSPDIVYPAPTINSEFSIYLSALRALTGRAVPLREVRLAYPRPDDATEHHRVFGPARVVFGTPQTQLFVDRSFLEVPILNANANLFPLFEQQAEALLRKQQRDGTLRERVKAEVMTLLKGQEPTLATIADRLALGVRTLQGRLREEGVTYQQLLDDVRRQLAEAHLRQAVLSTTDIAYLLGYAEPSVFFRAFKKWTGQTPGTYRQAAGLLQRT